MGIFNGVLIASDMDGTLLSSNHLPSDENIAAIRRFISQGGRFAVSTGRPYKTFKGIKGLVYNAPAIMANGASIIDLDTKTPLYSKGLDPAPIGLVYGVLAAHPALSCEFYPQNEPDKVYIANINDVSMDHMIVTGVGSEGYIEARPEDVPPPWLKLMFTGMPEELDGLEKELEGTPGVFMARSTPYYLEFMHPEVNKGAAVMELARLLGIDREHVYAIGDQQNDLAMLKAAKLAFAPQNASEAVRAAAHIMLPSNNDHAVARMIEHLEGLYGKA